MFIRLTNPYFEEVWEAEESLTDYNQKLDSFHSGENPTVRLKAKRIVDAPASFHKKDFGQEKGFCEGHILEISLRNFALVEAWE